MYACVGITRYTSGFGGWGPSGLIGFFGLDCFLAFSDSADGFSAVRGALGLGDAGFAGVLIFGLVISSVVAISCSLMSTSVYSIYLDGEVISAQRLISYSLTALLSHQLLLPSRHYLASEHGTFDIVDFRLGLFHDFR